MQVVRLDPGPWPRMMFDTSDHGLKYSWGIGWRRMGTRMLPERNSRKSRLISQEVPCFAPRTLYNDFA